MPTRTCGRGQVRADSAQGRGDAGHQARDTGGADVGLERIRAATGAEPDDARLTGVRLDLADPASIEDAAGRIRAAVQAPFGLVHNAGIVSVGCVEEVPFPVFEEIFTTNLFGAHRLTMEMLPSMRAAGRGRIVVVSSEGAIPGMPAISAYSASKGALERWAEALALEVAPFGIGIPVLVAGTSKILGIPRPGALRNEPIRFAIPDPPTPGSRPLDRKDSP